MSPQTVSIVCNHPLTMGTLLSVNVVAGRVYVLEMETMRTEQLGCHGKDFRKLNNGVNYDIVFCETKAQSN